MTQIYGNLLAQTELKQVLKNNVKNVCVTGHAHVGKSTFTKELILELVSDVDIFVAESRIDSAREAVEFCKTQPLCNQNKYVIVDDAHLLTESAQDAYLKILEETKENVCIIFIVPDDGLLQPAIKSRFRHIINFIPLNNEEMRQFAISVGIDENDKLIQLCGGCPGFLSIMNGNKDKYIELYNLMFSIFNNEINPIFEKTPEIIKNVKEYVDRECISHVCMGVAIEALKLGKIKYDEASKILKYSSLLISIPSINSDIHWQALWN